MSRTRRTVRSIAGTYLRNLTSFSDVRIHTRSHHSTPNICLCGGSCIYTTSGDRSSSADGRAAALPMASTVVLKGVTSLKFGVGRNFDCRNVTLGVGYSLSTFGTVGPYNCTNVRVLHLTSFITVGGLTGLSGATLSRATGGGAARRLDCGRIARVLVSGVTRHRTKGVPLQPMTPGS